MKNTSYLLSQIWHLYHIMIIFYHNLFNISMPKLYKFVPKIFYGKILVKKLWFARCDFSNNILSNIIYTKWWLVNWKNNDTINKINEILKKQFFKKMPKVKAVPQITYNTIAKFQYINRFYSTLITIFTLFTQCICLFVSETKKNRKKAAFQLGFLSHKLRNKTATRFSTLILHFSFCILHFCIPPPSKAWSPTLLHSSNVPL